jgi:beta-xylosidase
MLTTLQDDGSYVMYYSAALTQFSAHHCIGAAFATDIEGPYVAMDQPLVCPDPTANGANLNPVITSPGAGGAIDAAAFRDMDGQRYVLWKVDGNSVGSGGVCGNTNSPQRPTPIMLAPVEADGITPRGNPIQLLDRSDSDGPLIEAPNLVRTADGGYALFFSSNCYTTPGYDVAYATSKTLLGPYVKAPNPLIMTGTQGLAAPGGASIAADGQHMVFHANVGTGRGMFTTTISGDANSNSIRFS